MRKILSIKARCSGESTKAYFMLNSIQIYFYNRVLSFPSYYQFPHHLYCNATALYHCINTVNRLFTWLYLIFNSQKYVAHYFFLFYSCFKCCISFFCITKWISHLYTRIPSFPVGPPIPSPLPIHLGHQRAPSELPVL